MKELKGGEATVAAGATLVATVLGFTIPAVIFGVATVYFIEK